MHRDNLDASTSVYARLKARAVHQSFRPGEQLLVTKLAENFGVSPAPVREALTRLHIENLVELAPNRGFFARVVDLSQIRH